MLPLITFRHFFVLAVLFLGAPSVVAKNAAIEFDLPNTAAGVFQASPDGQHQVTFSLRLSSLIVNPSAGSVDQWIVRCTPRTRLRVLDYAPKTELHSGIDGPIQITQTRENSESFGLGLNADYQKMFGGHMGLDDQEKNLDSKKFNRLAPLQTVIASGTIDRGHGVFFKLRSTATSVLEGEKQFEVTFAVPSNWRRSIFDVSVIAQENVRGFSTSQHNHTLAAQHFPVAVYRSDDPQSHQLAQQLAAAERELRILADQISAQQSQQSSPWKHAIDSFTRWVAPDTTSKETERWLPRVLNQTADPHHDKTIRRLPMPVRVAVLDYAEARDAFENQSRVSHQTLVADQQ